MTLMGSDDPQTLCEFRRYTRPVARMLVSRLADADAILGLSQALTERALSFGWPPEKVRCSAMAKDVTLFRPARDLHEKLALREKLQIPPHAIAVAYVGYLSKRKGTDVLIHAWSEVLQALPCAHLIIAGEFGKRRDVTADLLHRLPPTSYRLCGALSRVEIAELLRAVDLFVFPTRREGFGAALLEAVMCGLPAVASHLPGITDMMVRDGKNGILCSPGDTTQVASGIKRLIQSEDLRKRMHAEALEVAKHFYPDAIWPTYRWAYTGK